MTNVVKVAGQIIARNVTYSSGKAARRYDFFNSLSVILANCKLVLRFVMMSRRVVFVPFFHLLAFSLVNAFDAVFVSPHLLLNVVLKTSHVGQVPPADK